MGSRHVLNIHICVPLHQNLGQKVLPDRNGLELRTKAVLPLEIVVPWMVQKHMRIHDANKICKVLGVQSTPACTAAWHLLLNCKS